MARAYSAKKRVARDAETEIGKDQVMQCLVGKDTEFGNFSRCYRNPLKSFEQNDQNPQKTVENYSRDGNTRPPDLPLEKPVCRSGSNS